MRIKVITLWQPWASLCAEGIKTIETRTHARFASLVGQRIGIHAGKAVDRNAMRLFRLYPDDRITKVIDKELPSGVILCTAFVDEHRRLTSADGYDSCLYFADDFAKGRYGLILHDIEKLDPPIPARGKQGIWHYDI